MTDSERPPPNRVAKALRTGWSILLMLAALNALLIGLMAVLAPARQPATIAWLNRDTILYQLSLHAVGGFLVGAFSLNLRKALVGAAFGPFIDFDHIGILFGLPVDGRIGHSLFMLGALVVVVYALDLWPSGASDFALFGSAQFAMHFALAPPGFPLLAPFENFDFFFSSAIPGAITFVLLFLIYSGRSGNLFGVWFFNRGGLARKRHPLFRRGPVTTVADKLRKTDDSSS